MQEQLQTLQYNKTTCKFDEITDPISVPTQTSETELKNQTHPANKQKRKQSLGTKHMSEKQMLIFDCETNGLLHDVSEIHCIAIYDSQKKKPSYLIIKVVHADRSRKLYIGSLQLMSLLVITLLVTTYLFFGKFILGLSLVLMLLTLLSYLAYIIQT